MQKIYVCSPYKGNTKENVKNARLYSRGITFVWLFTINSQNYSTKFFDVKNTKKRQLCLNIGLELLSECQEMWVFGLDKPSIGMQGEIKFAEEHSIPIYDGFEKISELIMLKYCEQNNIPQPSITEPILYFAGLALCEEKIREGLSIVAVFNFVEQLKQILGVF